MCVQQLINAGELAPYIGLRPRLTRLLELLAKYAGEKTQQLCCSQETLAAHLSCSVRTISRDLHTLSSLGLIHVQPRYLEDRKHVKHRTTDVITVHIPTVAEWDTGVRYDGSTRPAIKNANYWRAGAPDIIEVPMAPEK